MHQFFISTFEILKQINLIRKLQMAKGGWAIRFTWLSGMVNCMKLVYWVQVYIQGRNEGEAGSDRTHSGAQERTQQQRGRPRA